jgi:RHS repeat-associated protein
MPGRNYQSSTAYRYGFNGKENDNEIKGAWNSLDFGARIYDPRIGRWLSLDPLQKKYPFFSPYNFCGNNPIMFVDPNGKEITPSKAFLASAFGEIYSDMMKNNMTYRKIVKKFGGKQQNYNLKLGIDEAKIPTGADAYTHSTGTLMGTNLVTVKTEENFSVDKIMHSKEFISADGKTMITKYERTQISMVADVIHEALHSLIYSNKTYQDNNHNKHGESHDMLVNAMKEYSDDNCLNWSSEDIEIISWKGVQESKAFKSYITDLADKNKTTYDEELKSFNSKLSKLAWKSSTEEKKTEEKKTEEKKTEEAK